MELTISHNLLDLIHVGEIAGKVGGKEFRCVVAFEPAGLIAYPSVTGSVGLVECVLGELLPVFPDLVESLLGMAVGDSAGHKLLLELLHYGYLLLTHCFTQGVSLAFGEAGKLLRQKHHLLLVNRDAVGVVEILLHLGEVVLDWFDTLLAVDEVGDIVHRTRPVKGIHCDEILKTFWMELLEPGLHTFGFKLEHHGGVAASVEFEGGFIVDRDSLDVDVYPVAVFDIVEGFVDDGQGVEPEEIHLEHTHALDVVAVVLRCPHVQTRIFVLGEADGDVLREVARSDDGGAGVLAYLADCAFKLSGVAQDLPVEFRAVFELVLELRHKAIAVAQGNLRVNIFFTNLISLSVLFDHLEPRF